MPKMSKQPEHPSEVNHRHVTLDQLVLDIMTQNPNGLAIVSQRWQFSFAHLRQQVAQC